MLLYVDSTEHRSFKLYRMAFISFISLTRDLPLSFSRPKFCDRFNLQYNQNLGCSNMATAPNTERYYNFLHHVSEHYHCTHIPSSWNKHHNV
jgi:hypothetical protein